MQSILIGGARRRPVRGLVLLTALATLLVALSATAQAQEQPDPPHWFWGIDADAHNGATISAIDQNDKQVSSSTVDSKGGWHLTVSTEAAERVKLRLVDGDMVRETDFIDVVAGGFSSEGLSIAAFSIVPETLEQGASTTIMARIIARRTSDGRIEFGMRDSDNQDIFPRARYFPAGGPGHNRWLRSSEIDFGGGFAGQIIARYGSADGRTEFGFRVAGYEDIFPRARYFPATGPNHNRWLRSSEIELGLPR